MQNPFAATAAEARVRWLSKVPAVAHEGLRFDKAGVLYFVDEFSSGSIYKYVPIVNGNLGNGQTFVLKVSAYGGNAALDWNNNLTSPRVGAATWVPITDESGNNVTVANPFAFSLTATGGRDAADEVGGHGDLYGPSRKRSFVLYGDIRTHRVHCCSS